MDKPFDLKVWRKSKDKLPSWENRKLSKRKRTHGPINENKRQRNISCSLDEDVTGAHARKEGSSNLKTTTSLDCRDDASQACSEPELELGRRWCPISGCTNYNGKGFKNLQRHMQDQHSQLLASSCGKERERIVNLLATMNRVLCTKCHKIRAKALENGVCTTCWKEQLQKQAYSEEKITKDLTDSEEEELLKKIIKANRTTMRVVRCVPKSLTQWWSKAVTVTLLEWLNAKTAKQTLRAIERWSKLKSVFIRPIRAGKKRRTRGILTKWQINMEGWIEGEWEEVWKEDCDMEK